MTRFGTGLSIAGIIMSNQYGQAFALLSAVCLLVFATAWYKEARHG